MRRHHRAGFTLIELLVVIAIGTLLMALLMAAVQKVRDAGKRTDARTEIAGLTMAAQAFAMEMKAVPCLSGGGPNGEFRLCTKYTDAAGNLLLWPEVDFLLTAFPNINRDDNGLRVAGVAVPNSAPILLDGNQALIFWLSGGEILQYQGFSLNAARPFTASTAPAEKRKGPWAFPNSKYLEVNGSGVRTGRYCDPYGVPYACMGYRADLKDYPALASFGVAPFRDPSRGNTLYNASTIQVISAGRDKTFGPGGAFAPGQGSYAPNQPGGDDLANFKTGILGATD